MSVAQPHIIKRHSQAAVVVALFILLGVIYSLATPVFEASDEIFHYPVVQHIQTTGQLPVQVVGTDTFWEQEGSQPPLYYALAAGLTVWIDSSDMAQRLWYNPHARLGVPLDGDNKNMVIHTGAEAWPWRGSVLAVHLIRWAGVLMGAGSVTLTYALGLEVAPFAQDGRNRALSLTAAALVALNPMFLFISASVNNDNLMILLSASSLLVMVRIVKRGKQGLTYRRGFTLALLLALGALTKISGLTLFPLAGLVLLVAAWRDGTWREAIVTGLLVVALTLLIAGWWYGRNMRLYGEWLGLDTMVAVAGPRPVATTVFELRREWQGFWLSYWGLFGAVNILAKPPAFLVYNVVCLAGLGGLALYAWQRVRARAMADLLLPALLALQVLVVFGGVVRWTLVTLASQGRLMFPVVGAIGVLLAMGLVALLPQRWRRFAPGIVAVPLSVLALAQPFAVIAPVYAPPPVVENLPAGVVPVNVYYGDGLELVAVESYGAIVKPGELLPVTLYWRAVEPMSVDFSVYVHALGRDAAEIGKIDAYPGMGRLPTSHMVVGQIIRDEVYIPIDRTALVPTRARALVGVWNYETGAYLPVRRADGAPLDSVIVEAGAVVPREVVRLEPPIEQIAHVGQFGRLLGYDLSATQVAAGEVLTVDLYWRGLRASSDDLTVFVHLVDITTEQRVAQGDGPPLLGNYPTNVWQLGIDVLDTHTLALPEDLPAGEYVILVGFYDANDPAFPRVPVYAANRNAYPDAAIPLADVIRVLP